jgi:hypothetical protein
MYQNNKETKKKLVSTAMWVSQRESASVTELDLSLASVHVCVCVCTFHCF